MKLNEFYKYSSCSGKNLKEQLRENIIRVAISEFSKTGYNGTNVDLIAKRLGISKKTLYSIFPTKRDLFLNSCFSIFFGVADLLIPIFNNKNLPPLEKLSQLLNAIFQNLSNISLLLLNDLRVHFPEEYMEVLSFREFMISRYKDIFHEAQSSGIIRKDVDIDFLIEIIISIADNFVVPDYIISHNTTIKEVIEKFFNIILYGIINSNSSEIAETIT